MKTMCALIQSSLNGPKDMRVIDDAPVPSPRAGEVLLRVVAAGVNFADLSRSYGTFLNGPTPPYVAGFEAAGEVVALGPHVTGIEAGARLVGVGSGAFAEYMTFPAVAAIPAPPGWTLEQSLGLAVNWPTALAALELGRLAPGETVLIHAAAGATGSALLTLAKHRGARTIAAASPNKHDNVRAAGADHVLDSRSLDLAAQVLELTGGVGADVVLESAGGSTLQVSLAATRRVTGRVVVYGLAGGRASLTNWDLVYQHPVQLIGLNIGAVIHRAPQLFGELMAKLGALIAAGTVTPIDAHVRPLTDGMKVLQALEARETVGKWCLRP